MPDRRKHRGPHPEDQRWFSPGHLPSLRQATVDLSWLLTRGYAPTSALKLVGDRYSLVARQRRAVGRCACSDTARTERRHKQVHPAQLRGRDLVIDGYNVLTSVEAALSGGVILRARDGCFRDMASMHGSYRVVEETLPAIQLLGQGLAALQVRSCLWYLDQPVSNSGRLKQKMREAAEAEDWHWQIELVRDPDPVLSRAEQTVATCDSQILDKASSLFDLAGFIIRLELLPRAWIVDLSESAAVDTRPDDGSRWPE